MSVVRRARFRLRRGLQTRTAGELAREVSRRAISHDERFVWYLLDLGRVRELRLRGSFALRRVPVDEAEAVMRQVPAIPPWEARERVADGVELWAVFRGETAAFACFLFTPGSAPFPLEGARGGAITLPEGVGCLENGFTNPEFRGLALAPVSWTTIAGRLAEAGFRVLATKVEVGNLVSRRTVEKTGFAAATVMTHRRRGPWHRIAFSETGVRLTAAERAVAAELQARMAG